ncbi:MAG: hypothetical protein U9R26_02030 [Campylobacterota bacterium]|nr:hypothetical protein [Campylobacterota bacterium]
MTPAAKKTTAVLFLLFLLIFPKFSPWSSPISATDDSLMHHLFVLYFFIINQTLGIVHEAGHGVCYILPCPELFMVANGTFFQLFFPAGIGYYYKKHGNRFAALIALFFVGFSLRYTAWYMSTAHEGLHLPASKSFLGVDALHDFNYIFSYFHLLPYEGFISGLTGLCAYLLMIYAVIAMLKNAFVSNNDAMPAKKPPLDV